MGSLLNKVYDRATFAVFSNYVITLSVLKDLVEFYDVGMVHFL